MAEVLAEWADKAMPPRQFEALQRAYDSVQHDPSVDSRRATLLGELLKNQIRLQRQKGQSAILFRAPAAARRSVSLPATSRITPAQSARRGHRLVTAGVSERHRRAGLPSMSDGMGAFQLAPDPWTESRVSFERPKIMSAMLTSPSIRESAKDAARLRRHKDFLISVSQHASAFWSYHRTKYERLTTIAHAVHNQMEEWEREQVREEEREDKARLRALRANDMEAYTRLLQNAKNERLNFLLNETNKFLTDLGSLVAEQQAEAAPAAAPAAASSGAAGGGEEPTKMEEDDDFLADARASPPSAEEEEEASGVDQYYSLAHRIQEPISRQPRMLRGGLLKEYQLRGVEWLVSLYNNNLNGILADEMGLGKTIQTIALLAYIMENKGNKGPFLVVVPLSTIANWASEFDKWAPEMSVVRYHGNAQRRRWIKKHQMAGTRYNVLLTTYEYIMRDKSVLSRVRWQYIIIDEGHRMKNANSKFTQILGGHYTARNRLLLTGTPLQNNLPELWSLMNFLLPKIFGAVEGFEQWFSKPFANFRAAVPSGGPSLMDEPLSKEETLLIVNRLHQMLRPFLLRRVKAQVLNQLPDKVERIIRCDISAWQREWYNQIRSFGTIGLRDAEVTTATGGMRSLNNCLMQLRKVSNHPFLFLKEGYTLDENLIRCSGKLELLDRILPKLRVAGHRVLIFSQMTQMMDIMEDYLRFRGYRHLRLDGKTAADMRAERMAMFNNPDSPYSVFILSTRAGGLGINLASADTVILFDTDWNPTSDQQAQDRAHRIGQTQEVRVLRIITNTPVEDHILTRATDKANMGTMVLDVGEFHEEGRGAAAADRRRATLEDMINRDLDSARAGREVADGEQLNEILAREEAEFELFQRMDAEFEATYGPAKERLLTQEEVPRWVFQRPDEPGADGRMVPLTIAAGRTRRKRSRVSYAENLTDREFLELADSGATPEDIEEYARRKREREEVAEAAEHRRKRRARRKRGGYLKGIGDDSSDDSDDDEDDEDEDEEFVRPRRSASRRGGAGGAALPAATPKTPTRPPSPIDLEPPPADETGRARRAEVRGRVQAALMSMETARDPATGRDRAALFRVEPNVNQYPHYYERVKKPIALDTMWRRAREEKYPSEARFWEDVHRMVVNAHIFNERHSWVCDDALTLQSIAAQALGETVQAGTREERAARALADAQAQLRALGLPVEGEAPPVRHGAAEEEEGGGRGEEEAAMSESDSVVSDHDGEGGGESPMDDDRGPYADAQPHVSIRWS